MKTILKKGRGFLEINIPDNQIFDTITGKDVVPIDHDHIYEIIFKNIVLYAPEDIQHQNVAVIIPDDTRLWARGDLFVPRIVKTLMKLRVPKEQIKIIIALGTHADIPREDFSKLAGEFCVQEIDILNSANKNKDRLVYVGDTRRNTKVYITKEAAVADHIIIFGGILHHLIAGFGGGRKYILPGIAGYDTIQQNHSLTIEPDGSAHPRVCQAQLEGNPVNEDLTEAADLFLSNKTCTYVAVAANGNGDIFYADAGPLHETFLKGCKELNAACCVPAPEKGDFAIISAGGHRTDGQLYQSTKALFNAVNIVKEGGTIVFIAACSQGVGNQAFESVLKKYKNDPEKIGKTLTLDFNMPSYVAFRVLDLLKRFEVILVSDLSEEITEQLGFKFSEDMNKTVKNIKGKGYIIPYAENILPVWAK